MPVNVSLVNNNRQGVESFAQGGIYKECLALTTLDTSIPAAWPIPNGTKIYVSPALWD